MLSIDVMYKVICKLLGAVSLNASPGEAECCQGGDDWEAFTAQDWREMVELAAREGVAPLLYRGCQQGNWADFPEEARTKLVERYYGTSAQNAMLLDELQRVVKALNVAGIRVLVIKGADLAQTLYPEVGLRPMADLDLLIPKQSFEQARAVVEQGLGYMQEEKEAVGDIKGVVGYHVDLKGGTGGLIDLELHWTLVTSEESWYAVPAAWFWEQSQPFVEIGGTAGEARRLTNEANLLYLSAHAVLQHGVRQSLLIWLYDLHALVTKYGQEIDWEWLMEEAMRLGWAPALIRGLRESRERFGTRLPEAVAATMHEEGEGRVGRLVDFMAEFPGARLLYDWDTLMALRWPERVRYAAALVFPSGAYLRWRYQPRPVWLWPIYYPYRWGRMALDVCQVALNGLRRRWLGR